MRLSLSSFSLENAVAGHIAPGLLDVTMAGSGGRIVYAGDCAALGAGGYLVFEAYTPEEHSVCLLLEFWQQEAAADAEADFWVKVGILPGLPTTIAFPLQALDSRRMFIPPAPGRLKMVAFGKPFDVARMGRFAIGTTPCHHACRLRIVDVQATLQEPAYHLPEGVKLVDGMGQLKTKRFAGKFDDEKAMTAYLRAEYEQAAAAPDVFPFPHMSRYGGDTRRKFEATGYFRSCKDGRWWLVDPEGNAFFSTGLDCVGTTAARLTGLEPFFEGLPERDDAALASCYTQSHGYYDEAGKRYRFFDFNKANLIRAFGDCWFERFAVLTRHRLKRWGFNTIGNWSDERFIAASGMPYVFPMEGFPGTKEFIFRDFPDVFAEEYEKNARVFSGQLAAKLNDRNMIGYFMRNEPTWAFVEGLCIAEEMLAHPARFASKTRLVEELRGRYGSASALGDAWGLPIASFDDLYRPIRNARSLGMAAARDLDGFSHKMYEAYNTVPAVCCRAVDARHMNLGMRYGYISQPGVLAGWRSFDCFSINSYSMRPNAQIDQAAALLDLPIMVGEYHFGSLEGGLTATGLRAVTSQEERGAAYRYFLEQGAAHPSFVGAHYFPLYDQPPLGRFDGENYQIGFATNTHVPYAPLVEAARLAHEAMYDVCAGVRPPYARQGLQIPRIAF